MSRAGSGQLGSRSALDICRKYVPGVVSVKDAKRDISISVTVRDCQGGDSLKPDNCAMAKACKREGFQHAIISKSVAYLIKDNMAVRFRVPNALRTEIVSFDRNHDFRPGEFTLKSPVTTEKLGFSRPPRTKSAPKRKRQSGEVPRRVHKTEGIREI